MSTVPGGPRLGVRDRMGGFEGPSWHQLLDRYFAPRCRFPEQFVG